MQDRNGEPEPGAESGPAGSSPAGQGEDQAAPGGAAAESGTLPLDETGAGQAVTDDATGKAAPRTGGPRQRRRLALGIAAAATAALVAFAAFAAAGGLSGPADASSAIPSPPRENKVFVEDDDGTGADSQANILASAAPGLVHILAASGTSAGIGVILTPSGLVLTGAQVIQGARRLTARVVLSGRSYPARLVGTDRSHGLSLLQITGAAALRPVAIGNSRYLSRGAAVTSVGSAGLTRTFTLDIGNLTGGTGAAAAGGQRLTGLLVSTARVMAGEETGGPLVNLSGQVIGINVGGTGSGLHHTGFAVPIDTALAVATRIQAANPR